MTQTQRWVNLSLLFVALVLFLFANQLFGFLWNVSRLPVPDELPIAPAAILSAVIAGGIGFWIRRSERVNAFLNDVALELSRVVWPNRKETVTSAMVVIVLVGLSATFLFFIDLVWGIMMRGVLSL
ncbi:MAG: preprotein translocase subunit SecE [Deltaproteobacteria bacterium]|nr:preprotein translocase subunit SecE [Deltaproteobacteria bacterium]